MTVSELPVGLRELLSAPHDFRAEPRVAEAAIGRLGVSHALLESFFKMYEGPFWSDHLGCELMDLCAGDETIESATKTCRASFQFGPEFIILTQLTAGQVLVLDADKDKVYEVDFEGAEKMLIAGRLEPTWRSLSAFLRDYFLGLRPKIRNDDE